MKSNFYKSIIILFTFTLLVMVGLWVFLFRGISINKNEVKDVLIEIQTQKEKNTSLSSVRSLVSDVKDKVAILDDNFIYSDNIAGFVESLENEAKNSHVSLSLSNLSFDAESVSNVKPLTAHLDVNGNWFDLVVFLGRLERFPKVINIDKVSLNRMGDAQSKKAPWRANFDIKTSVIEHLSQ